MLKFLIRAIEFVSAIVYAVFLVTIKKTPRRVAIYYHTVAGRDIDKFEKQMAYLACRYKIVKPSQIKTVSVQKHETLVAITFDDAFISVVENAVPILKKYGLVAGIFVPTGNLEQSPKWNIPNGGSRKKETVVGLREIIELDREGFEICSHTVSHPMLTEVRDAELKAEMEDSKRVLEKIVGHQVITVSYPHGDYSAGVCKAAERAGYQFGFTIEPLMADRLSDDMRIGRFYVSPKDSLTKFKLKVSGAYEVVHYLQTLKRLLAGK